MDYYKKINLVPDIEIVKKVSQSIATLDAIMSPKWEYRHYSFNSKWGIQEQMASMKDGSGDEYFIIFTKNGCAIKLFDHESEMNLSNPPTSLIKNFPELLTEPAFNPEDRTYYLWRTFEDIEWNSSMDESLTSPKFERLVEMLSILKPVPEIYKKWADEYYGKNLPLEAISRVYEHRVLDENEIKKLNPEVKPSSLQKDLEEIGYPNI